MARNWKRFCLVLTVVLVLVLVLLLTEILMAKPEPTEVTEPTESTPAPTIAEPISLEKAVKNLSSARSLRLTISMLNTTDTYSYDTRYCFQFCKTPDGTQTILYSQSSTMQTNGETIESQGDQAYYHGNLAYIHYVYGLSGNSAVKYISDEGYNLGQVLEEQTGFYQEDNGNNMLEAFAGLSPVWTLRDDNSTFYQLHNIGKETFAIVYGAFAGEDAAEEMVSTLNDNCTFNISAEIDPQGYLCQFKFEILNVPSGTQTQDITILFMIDKINQSDNLEQPDYAENFSLADNAQIVYIQNKTTAHYYYRSGNTDLGIPAGFVFGGFGEAHSDNYTVEHYQVLSQIDDVPVTEIQGILNNKKCSVSVARLVIPEGVRVNIRGVYDGTDFISNTENTALYFADKEENVEKTFQIAGQTGSAPEIVYFQSACYAGQWDYVDGIPVPNK